MAEYYSIIRRPIVTERATGLKASMNAYVLEVAPDANKMQIRDAVEKFFKVN